MNLPGHNLIKGMEGIIAHGHISLSESRSSTILSIYAAVLRLFFGLCPGIVSMPLVHCDPLWPACTAGIKRELKIKPVIQPASLLKSFADPT
jgi:hypothetical protein